MRLVVMRRKYLPANLPLNTTVLWFIALDHWNASQTVRGAFYVLLGIAWVASLICVFTQEQRDPLWVPQK